MNNFKIGETTYNVVAVKVNPYNGMAVIVTTYRAEDGYTNYAEFGKAKLESGGYGEVASL